VGVLLRDAPSDLAAAPVLTSGRLVRERVADAWRSPGTGSACGPTS